jgi:signal transduction histidine kinase/CheY-like chemotaxis protein/HPt (histidine-containing phosphotransfer) domain-containing protein
MFLRILLVVLALVMSACLVMELRMKQRSVGFMLAAAFAVACNMICFFLLDCEEAQSAHDAMVAFYICYAWLYFGVFLTMCDLEGNKSFRRLRVLTAIIALYQTGLILSDPAGNRILTMVQRDLLGSAWWIVKEADYRYFLFSFYMYRGLLFVASLLIIYVMVRSGIHCLRIFRFRYYILISLQTVFLIVETVSEMYALPIWIICMWMAVVCVAVFYFFHFYCDHRFREWALMSFANEMSDGFLLYDEDEQLIHMNDRLKNTLPQELLESFADKDELDEWISKTTMINNTRILVYSSMSEEIYYKVKKTELGGLGTIYILHDTTETILKIRAMEQANLELERAARMKSDFLANMSHEIRTPMNAVIGMTEIAMREKLPPHVLEYLSQIQNSGKNLSNIINDILDFSKIEAGKMEIVPERYEPLAEIGDIANVLMTRVGDKKLEILVTAKTQIPHALEGDAMRIRQIIINLANNAIKFTKEGVVQICISCEQTDKEEVMLTYHVIDTGSGIKKDDLDKLFESFQQVDSKRNRSVEGTGLGLAISRRLCEQMGGSMGVTSEYGKGSDFYFTIPQKVLEPESDLIVKDAKNKHVFCMNEDERMTGEFLAEMTRLGVEGRVITSLDEYTPTGEKDYLLFIEDAYDEEIHSLLVKYPECSGVILVDFDSAFEADLPNLRVMRRPETTLGMVMILNGQEVSKQYKTGKDSFAIDFIAPEARILIVDDNAINITITEGLLRPLRAQCFSALSGREAIEMVEKESFDLILMDHMMPEMDGVETTKVIREMIPSAADTPILALTANVMEGVKEMFLREGMNDFIAKPIDIRVLAMKMKQWLPEDKILDGEEIELAAVELSEEDSVEYKGLDSVSAIRALGSVALYQKVVEEYFRTGRAKYEKIMEAYEKEEWEDYTIKVHALKSSSRQIGAMELGNRSEELEKAGKALDLDTIHKKNGDTMRLYEELLAGLSGYFAEEKKRRKGTAVYRTGGTGRDSGGTDGCL